MALVPTEEYYLVVAVSVAVVEVVKDVPAIESSTSS
jgi:hypothetical protein